MDCCSTNKDEKTNHNHKVSMMNHDSANSFLKRFWIVTVLLVPLALTNSVVSGFLGIDNFEFSKYIQFGIATIIFLFSLVFFKHALHEIRSKKYGMMTLVSIAVLAGYGFSAVSTFVPKIETMFYLEISTLIWVLLFGHYLEAKSGKAAGDALDEVAKLLPSKSIVIKYGKEKEVSIKDLMKDDIVLVKAGEKIPADGIIEKGESTVDESHITGESKPIPKKESDEVFAGSICNDGSLRIRLTKVGNESTVGKIENLIKKAQETKPSSQKLADKAARYLTFISLVVSIFTFIIWAFVTGETIIFALTLSITVLVITCPHALGLAIPTVTTIATSLASKNGIFIKDLSKIEKIKDIDYVAFDKTGTLTKGSFEVVKINSYNDVNEKNVLRLVASIEKESSHPLAKAIVKKSKQEEIDLKEASDFKNIAGRGVEAEVERVRYFVGNIGFVRDKVSDFKDSETAGDETGTKIYIADEKKVIGSVILKDQPRDDSKETIRELHNKGIKVAMITGDNEAVAKETARELNIDTYYAEVLPDEKFKKIKELQKDNHNVMMVGDGVNDAPALTQANIGVVIGSGTDIAVEAGDVILTNDSPKDVVKLIILSEKVYGKMIQNLWWALGYNIVAIPAAAGVFAGTGFILRPEVGALVMGLSTVIVVVNALTLKRINL